MDPIYFSGEELLAIALRIEENGWGFYSEAYKGAQSEKMKELFDYLAKQELEHIESFKKLYKLVKREKVKTFDELAEDDEAALYLRALSDSRVFTDPGEGMRRARSLTSDKEALDVALGFEKDSILFYYEMAKVIKGDEKKIVESLIEQEKEHFFKLSRLKKEYL